MEGAPPGVRVFPDRRFWRYSSAVRYALILNESSLTAWLQLGYDDPIRWTVRRT